MRFALDTVRDVIHGDSDRRIHALLAFGLWFVAGAFVASTGQFYLGAMESSLAPIIGGVVTAILAALIKVS